MAENETVISGFEFVNISKNHYLNPYEVPIDALEEMEFLKFDQSLIGNDFNF